MLGVNRGFKPVGPSVPLARASFPTANRARVHPKAKRPLNRKFQTSMTLTSQYFNRFIGSGKGIVTSPTKQLPRQHRWFRPFHPHSQQMRNWGIVSIVSIVFTAIVTPFETAFMTTSLDSWLFYVNRCVDLCFFADAVLQFFLMYYDDANSIWVADPRKIARKYLLGWFGLDMLSILPFDVVGLALANTTVKQLRFTRVLRLLRLMKIIKVLRRATSIRLWESKMVVNYATVSLVKFCLIVLMTSHWMACIFRMVVDIEDYIDSHGVKMNWMTEHNMGGAPIAVSGMGIQYMSALYWSSMTLTTIGYGDLVPTTPGERALAIMCMLIGGGTYAYVVGSVCQILNSMDASTTEFHQTIDTLNEYCRHNKLPAELSSRLREYFHSSRTLLRERQHHNLLLTMSPGLRGEVALYNNQWIANIDFFNCSSAFERSQFITAVALLLRHECFPPNEYVIREGEYNTKMYLIQRGIATKGKVMYSGGSFFGEDIILTLRQRRAAVRAFSYLHVQVLSKFELEELIYSGLYPEIQRNIRRQVLKAAFKNNFVKLSQDTIRRRSTESPDALKQSLMVNLLSIEPVYDNLRRQNNDRRLSNGPQSPQSHPKYPLHRAGSKTEPTMTDDDTVDTIIDSVSTLMDANIAHHDKHLISKLDEILARITRLEKYVTPNVIYPNSAPAHQVHERSDSAVLLQAVQELERGETRSLVKTASFKRRTSCGT
ncbi:hypothetical protein AC1031_011685 [Aphanomyces cochlioides]|nr:hypothetical protein AC1031_011685 [Aphanomyces cochlioides]